jgi:hypothetical protein
MSLRAIVTDYLTNRAPGDARYLRFYKAQRSLHEAIEKATLAVLPSGKRFSHQRLIPKTVLAKALATMTRMDRDLSNCANFNELHSMVRKTIGSIRGVGPLMIYDTSHRLGAFLGLHPERVYLHAGTRAGAKALKIKKLGSTLEMSQLPVEFHRLRPEQIEDCLCVYKNNF